MRRLNQALVGPADRWSVFFEKLGLAHQGLSHSRYVFIPELKSYCRLSAKEPTYPIRAEARGLAIREKANVIFLIGCPSNVSMRNMLFIPPQTPEDWEKYNDPGRVYIGWFYGNFGDSTDGGIYFNRLSSTQGHWLGKSTSGVSVFDAFVASLQAFRGSLDG